MLVLSRKLGQRIWIGNVCITVTDIDRGRVRIGFEADRSVEIVREELLEDTDPRSPHYRPPLTIPTDPAA